MFFQLFGVLVFLAIVMRHRPGPRTDYAGRGGDFVSPRYLWCGLAFWLQTSNKPIAGAVADSRRLVELPFHTGTTYYGKFMAV